MPTKRKLQAPLFSSGGRPRAINGARRHPARDVHVLIGSSCVHGPALPTATRPRIGPLCGYTRPVSRDLKQRHWPRGATNYLRWLASPRGHPDGDGWRTGRETARKVPTLRARRAAGTSLAYLSLMDESPVAVSTREPSIFLISLHIVMWTTFTCGLVMVMVVYMLN